MLADVHELLEPLRAVHDRLRDAVVAECEKHQVEDLAGIEREAAEDTIYSIDAIGEKTLLDSFDALRRQHSFLLIAEGLENDSRHEAAPRWRIIVDPIDGTRGIMYQKRSAWILTGVAPDLGPATSLEDVVLAVQTEIPLVKQHLSDQLWAIKSEGTKAERYNRLTGERVPFRPRPSQATSIAHGFAMIARFFPGVRDELAAIDEEIVRGALGPVQRGKAHCFEDQYISTGGQLYELIVGHDRFVADLRPLTERVIARRGLSLGICCHPYDLCTAMIAREAGVIITNPAGDVLRAPLDVTSEVTWAGYANAAIRNQIEPLLQAALRRRGWI